MVSAAILCVVVKGNDSVSFSFFFPCFLFSSLRTKYIFFSIKANRSVFELSVPCVYLFHCVIATEFNYMELQLVQSTACN